MKTQRPNAYAGEMGRKYVEAMKVICPQHEIAKEKLKDCVVNRSINLGAGTLLDLGCGGAEFMRELHEDNFLYTYLSQTGVDNSSVMIKKARKLLQGRSGIRIVQADITKYLEAMNLVGQQTDIITSNFVMHNFSRREREIIFPLIYQAISSEGLFIMEDKVAHSNPEIHKRVYRAQLDLVRTLAEHGMPELVQPWLRHYQEDNGLSRRMVESELNYSLRQAGFRAVKTLYRSGMEAIVEAKK